MSPRTPRTGARVAAANQARAPRTAGANRRDPERMRQRILNAATREFAQHGFAGARVEAISRRAGTVDRMLYYHFGNKAQLYYAVLAACYEQLGSAEQSLDLQHLTPSAAIERLVAFTWEYYLANPEFIQLLSGENLLGGALVKRVRSLTQLSSPLIDILREILRRGADCGEFRADADPVKMYLSIAALGYFYLSNRHTLSRFLGYDLMASAAREQWVAHATAMVLAYLRSETI